MKKQLIITIFFITSVCYAEPQRGRMGGSRSFQNNSNQSQVRKVTAFSASKAAGIFYYDVSKILKKLKVKDQAIKTKVSSSLREYNRNVKAIEKTNKDDFEDLNAVMKIARTAPRGNQSSNNSNQNMIFGVRKRISEVIRPIKSKIISLEVNLNERLKLLLDENQFKKFTKYQNKKKENLMPKRPSSRQNSNSQIQRRGGQRGGF